jgi:hypothetical protein
VLIDRASFAGKLFFGAMNTGTVTIGELLPYIHALTWYTGRDGPGRQRQRDIAKTGRQLEIHIVTDSEIVAKTAKNPESRKSHRELWAALDAYVARGFLLTFHYVARDRVNLNILVDQVSRRARLTMSDVYQQAINDLRKKYPGLPEDMSIYDFIH